MPEPFKETLFNRQAIHELGRCIASVYLDFEQTVFLERIFDSTWAGLELKERMRHITLILKELLPPDYPSALNILRQAAAEHQGGGFATLVFCDYVELYGLEDWEFSLPALAQFTCLCSAEFAVRPFIVKDQARMLAQMLDWAGSDNLHHRRLASEGCRPRLPWGIALPALKADPRPILPILEQLKKDSEDTVRRSVANNLNDIAKDNPQVVIDLLQTWKAESIPAFTEIAQRALRTLIKNGDPFALALVGFEHGSQVEVSEFKIEPVSIPLGGEVTFSFNLQAVEQFEQNLVVDYVVYLMRANGKQTPKVFKLTKKTLAAGETTLISKRHSFAKVTTRRYYPGLHAIEIQVNGVSCARAEFEIRTE